MSWINSLAVGSRKTGSGWSVAGCFSQLPFMIGWSWFWMITPMCWSMIGRISSVTWYWMGSYPCDMSVVVRYGM